eukprot:CAMPEP_0197679866 /NCGR_PEP_ID=MMETSP1338-20131121/92365_1 /TAXON_ID=43686 ORGANISM="Pelagodinium beii, Strain RCC1491" /NCGR_SAMPLE_ID=MMETSP1338 /ASSEMBLY_ACC=CAM_ASM_000754 /LENGTH=482 /DNA_ID=CAMNT_0043260969 /DNA_START=31 /DNA_END=1476 /DNA_ORIENTATION=-
MEYASGGELFDYIVAKGRVPEPEACRFFHQIIAGLEKVHAMNIVHRDLKPENLLLDEHKNIKIVDFGLSNVFRDGQLLKTACGSPCYAAPEMIAGYSYVPSLCDLWSCGVILFALVCGYLPFEDQNTPALYKKILAADYRAPKSISEAARDLISRLLTTEPARRYTVPDVRNHAWYRQISESSAAPCDWMPGHLNFEEDVLRDLDAFGFPRDYAVRCLELNKHNHVTTTYYLLTEKKRRMLEKLDQLMPGGVVDPHAAFDAGYPAACANGNGMASNGLEGPRATQSAREQLSPREAGYASQSAGDRGQGSPGAPPPRSARGEQPASTPRSSSGAKQPGQGRSLHGYPASGASAGSPPQFSGSSPRPGSGGAIAPAAFATSQPSRYGSGRGSSPHTNSPSQSRRPPSHSPSPLNSQRAQTPPAGRVDTTPRRRPSPSVGGSSSGSCAAAATAASRAPASSQLAPERPASSGAVDVYAHSSAAG